VYTGASVYKEGTGVKKDRGKSNLGPFSMFDDAKLIKNASASGIFKTNFLKWVESGIG
jgi:hypothetical protein